MLLCAGLALVGGIVSVNLWRELRAERELTAELRTQLTDRPMAMSGTAAMAAPAVPEPVTGAPAAMASTGKSEPATAGREPERLAPQAVELPRFLLDQQEMMKDPEYRKARLAQTRFNIPQNYPGLAEELGLTPEEADRLFDLLAENQLEMSDVSMLSAVINGVPPDPAVMEDANRRRQEMQRRHDESLTAMLGSNRFSQWQEYQQTRGARQQVVQLSRSLEGIGAPLTPEQSRPLTAAYVAEQKRQREDMQRMLSSQRQSGPGNQEQMQEERYRFQAESNRRIVDAAKPHLNPQQLDALQASLDQQLAMNRSLQRLNRQQPVGQGQAPITSITIVAPPGAAPPMPLP
jgi:hypothetical protein